VRLVDQQAQPVRERHLARVPVAEVGIVAAPGAEPAVVHHEQLMLPCPVTVNDVLDGHTSLEIDCVDRLYLSLSVPNLMVGGQVAGLRQSRMPGA